MKPGGPVEPLGCVVWSPRTKLSLTFSFVLSYFEAASGPEQRFCTNSSGRHRPEIPQGPRSSCPRMTSTNREEYTIFWVRGVGNKLGQAPLPCCTTCPSVRPHGEIRLLETPGGDRRESCSTDRSILSRGPAVRRIRPSAGRFPAPSSLVAPGGLAPPRCSLA